MNSRICETKGCDNQNFIISTNFCEKCGKKSVFSEEGKKLIVKVCKNNSCPKENKLIQCSTENYCGSCGNMLKTLE
jgi:hypothetical protein